MGVAAELGRVAAYVVVAVNRQSKWQFDRQLVPMQATTRTQKRLLYGHHRWHALC